MGAYHSRTLEKAADLGLAVGERQLGVRRPRGSDAGHRTKTWKLERVPRTWDVEGILDMLREAHFVDPEVTARYHRRAQTTEWWFKAARTDATDFVNIEAGTQSMIAHTVSAQRQGQRPFTRRIPGAEPMNWDAGKT